MNLSPSTYKVEKAQHVVYIEDCVSTGPVCYLRKHKDTVPSTTSTYVCQICGRFRRSLSGLRRHLRAYSLLGPCKWKKKTKKKKRQKTKLGYSLARELVHRKHANTHTHTHTLTHTHTHTHTYIYIYIYIYICMYAYIIFNPVNPE